MAWFTLALLTLTYVIAYTDRQVLGILVQPIKRELHVSDTALGFLGGTTFALFYASLGVPLARLADHLPRRSVLSAALAAWSVMTGLTALVGNFWQLLVLRIGVAVGEAGCNPSAHSLIADYFPVRQRATALSLYGLGLPFGIGFGMLIGGLTAQHFGWRAAFLFLGAPGLVFALVLRLVLREPRRGLSDAHRADGHADENMPIRQLLSYLLSLRSYVHMTAGVSLQAVAMTAASMWNPAFLMRSYHMSIGAVGVTLALIQCLVGGSGALAGGVLSDRLQRLGASRQLVLLAVASIVACPVAFAAYSGLPAPTVLALIAGAVFLQNIQYGTSTSLSTRLAPLRGRGLITGLSLFTSNLLAALLGAQLVGFMSDLLQPSRGVDSLRYAMGGTAAVFLTWATAHYLLAARAVGDDLKRFEGPGAGTSGKPYH
ncbi:MAG: MFS transporter [Caulobacteraceae bacterium]|nr:MFS transporter [Caulobacteraceae bacterium]